MILDAIIQMNQDVPGIQIKTKKNEKNIFNSISCIGIL